VTGCVKRRSVAGLSAETVKSENSCQKYLEHFHGQVPRGATNWVNYVSDCEECCRYADGQRRSNCATSGGASAAQ
jgi:hypothetical protein